MTARNRDRTANAAPRAWLNHIDTVNSIVKAFSVEFLRRLDEAQETGKSRPMMGWLETECAVLNLLFLGTPTNRPYEIDPAWNNPRELGRSIRINLQMDGENRLAVRDAFMGLAMALAQITEAHKTDPVEEYGWKLIAEQGRLVRALLGLPADQGEDGEPSGRSSTEAIARSGGEGAGEADPEEGRESLRSTGVAYTEFSPDIVESAFERRAPPAGSLADEATVQLLVDAFARVCEGALLIMGGARHDQSAATQNVLDHFVRIFRGKDPRYSFSKDWRLGELESFLRTTTDMGQTIEDLLQWGAKEVDHYLSDYAFGFLTQELLDWRREVVVEELTYRLTGRVLDAEA